MSVAHKKFSSIPSPERLAFAEMVVNKAGVLDDSTATILYEAFSVVQREFFVETPSSEVIYKDVSLPIGYGQVSSAPSLLARMMGLMGIRKDMKVLEIGCGSGYATAIMAAAGAKVFGVETIGLLAQSTRRRLDALYFHDVIVQRGEGSRGWREHAPFDAIMVSTPMSVIDKELFSQLVRPNGKLVAPIGGELQQTLSLCEVRPGGVTTYQLEACCVNEEKIYES